MSSLRPPNVRLKLRNLPENVSLIRTTLAGVAEAIELPAEALDDVSAAVTEAANNVVLHAYAGDQGLLEVDIQINPSSLSVIVRDEGVGFSGEAPAAGDPRVESGPLSNGEPEDDSLKLGLAVITTLASHAEFRVRDGGGTEVCMEFAAPEINLLDWAVHDESSEIPVIELGGPPLGPSGLNTDATIAVAPQRLARAVLPRLLCALAARAHFSTDRLSDTQLLADAIATQAFPSIVGEHLYVAVAVAPRQVELHVGPLLATPTERASIDDVLGELAPLIQRLADDPRLTPAGPASILALVLSDTR